MPENLPLGYSHDDGKSIHYDAYAYSHSKFQSRRE